MTYNFLPAMMESSVAGRPRPTAGHRQSTKVEFFGQILHMADEITEYDIQRNQVSMLWDILHRDVARGLCMYFDRFIYSDYKEQAEEILANYYEMYADILNTDALSQYAAIFAPVVNLQDVNDSINKFQVLYEDVSRRLTTGQDVF